MGSSTVSDGAIVSNTDSLDPRRSDPCVVSSPITVTSATVNQRLGINRGIAGMPTKRFLVVVAGSDHVENLRGAT